MSKTLRLNAISFRDLSYIVMAAAVFGLAEKVCDMAGLDLDEIITEIDEEINA